MAIEAPLSKYKKTNFKIAIVVLLGLGCWFAYDGYLNQKFIEKNTENYGTEEAVPNSTLAFNRKAPPFLIAGAIVAAVMLVMIKDRKIVAGENSLITPKGEIAYDSIEKINKTNFDNKGFFVITSKQGDKETDIKISDRNYDNLSEVLDELIKQIS